jgi:F-type H+-transporting ATPase subunit b
MSVFDVRLILTQIIGFLLMVWVLRRYAWTPVLQLLEARRQKIEGAFREAEQARAQANDLKVQYEAQLKNADAEARQRIQAGVAEGQRVAAEIKTQAQEDAERRIERAQDEILREREKAKEALKEQVIRLSMRTAEKILRQRLDDPAQRKLVGEFIDEVGALR